ncbi:MAG: hypothetical protein WBG50_09575 [Desulfomonilaceae bacterium]
MARRLVAITAILILACFPAVAAGVNISGNWESRVMGSLIQATINQNGNHVAGVARVYSPLGQKDTYHFTGKIDGARVFASHGSGHSFSGNLTPTGHLVGVLKTKEGYQVMVDASRR